MQFHKYDLNLSEIRDQLVRYIVDNAETKDLNKLENALVELDLMGGMFCEQLGINYFETAGKFVPIIVDSTSNSYHVFLSIHLNYLDVYKINNFLEYHFGTFKQNYYAKDNKEFVGLLEFTVYDKVKLRSLNETNLRRENLMRWINEKRKVIKNYPIHFNSRTINISSHYRERLFTTLEEYFHQSDHAALKVLINGDPIEGRVTFRDQASRLLDLFLRFYDEQLIPNTKKNLQDWVCHFFQYEVNGEPKKITQKLAHKIISTNSQPCKKPIPFNFKYLAKII